MENGLKKTVHGTVHCYYVMVNHVVIETSKWISFKSPSIHLSSYELVIVVEDTVFCVFFRRCMEAMNSQWNEWCLLEKEEMNERITFKMDEEEGEKE